VVAVADPLLARCEEAVAAFDCQAYDDYTALLGDPRVELMVVALPTHLHVEATVAALQAGKHTVCEKPMAPSLAGADAMLDVADGAEPVLTIFQNRRYVPDFLKVCQVIASGVLGRIVQVTIAPCRFGRRWDWQTLRRYGGGTLNNTAVHFIDQAMILFGDGEPEVFCRMERALTLGDADDHVKLVLRGEGAPLIDVEVSSSAAYPPPLWRVWGTQGGLQGTATHLTWKTINPDALPPREVDPRPTPDRSYNREELAWTEHDWDVAEYDGPGQRGFYLDLYQTLRHGEPLAVTPASARRVISVLEACREQSPV
jgi:predicted dehydrogenase